MATYTVEAPVMLQRLERKFQRKMDAMEEKRKFKRVRHTFAHLRGTRTDDVSDAIDFDLYFEA